REKIEASIRSKRGAGDDRRHRSLEEIFAKDRREVERHGRRAHRAVSSLCFDPAHRWLTVARIERASHAVAGILEPANDRAHLVEERHQFFRTLSALETLAHELQSLAEQVDLSEGVAEGGAQSRAPNWVFRKVLGEAQLHLATFPQERVEQVEQHAALLARRVDGG